MSGEYTKADMRNLLISTCAAAIIAPLMSTMMNLALLTIGTEFGVGSHDQAYVNTMFLLGSVFGMVPAAKYSSIYGMKKVFITGHVIIAIGCALAILTPDFWFLTSMRFLIGVGASMTAVTAMSMLTFVFPIEHRGKVLGFNTTFVYIGLSLGPTIGGLITDFLGWRAIFGFIFILSIIPLFVIYTFKKEIAPTPDRHMDWTGSLMWGVTVLVLMFGVVNITEPWAKVMALIGFAMLIGTWHRFKHTPEPVLSVDMFRNRVFTRASLAAFMNYGASYCITFFLALYLQSIGEMTPTEAGGLMLIQPLMQVILTMKMGELSDRMSDKRILPALGMTITGIGVAMYFLLDTSYSMPLVIAIMVMVGTGLGIFSAPNTTLIVSSVSPELKGEASGIVAVVRQVGMMVSMAIAMSCISLIMGSTDNLSPATYEAFVNTMHATFAVCTAMCFVGALCSLAKVTDRRDE